jgi:Uma2 family endonuclease
MSTTTRLRLEEFLAMPDIEERRLELIDGEVVEKPMPTWGHARTAGTLITALNRVGIAGPEARAIVPASAAMDASALLPDVAFYRENPPAEDGWMTRPPHVAVEILSPGQGRRDLRAKVDAYIAFGVESVWVVDPATRTVDVYENGERRTLGEDDTLESPAAPGFAMTVAEILGPAGG